MTTLMIDIDWETIHAAAGALDGVRGRVGYYGGADAFGGTYYGPRYEALGLAGLADIARAARRIARHAWDIVHAASDRVCDARQPRDADYRTQYWSVGTYRGDKVCRSHRGAAWRSTRYGGRVEERRVLVQTRIEARVESEMERARQAVRAAIAVHALRDALHDTGIIRYDPATTICGIHDSRLNMQGISWLAGHATDSGQIDLAAARRFAAGATAAEALLAAQDSTAAA